MEQGTSSNKELTVESVSNRKGKRSKQGKGKREKVTSDIELVSNRKGKRSKQGKGKREKVTSDIELVSNRKGKRINPKPLKF